MPSHRIFEPDINVLGRAAILSGILCRVQGYAAADRLRALNDCILFLQALKLGSTILTRNIADFVSNMWAKTVQHILREDVEAGSNVITD